MQFAQRKKLHIDLLKFVKIYLGYEFVGDKFDENNTEIKEHLKNDYYKRNRLCI